MDKLKNKIQENIHDMDLDQPSAQSWDKIKNSLSKNAESDLLKKHISRNKAELDIETPDAAAWEHIQESVTGQKHTPVKSFRKVLIYISAAACIMVIIAVSVLWNRKDNQTMPPQAETENSTKEKLNTNNASIIDSVSEQLALQKETLPIQEEEHKKAIPKNNIPLAANLKTAVKKTKLPPQVVQMEKDYDAIIESQLKYTRSLAIYGESSAYFAQFKNDFIMLEEQEKALRKDIAKNGLQETSIDELAMIYQQKLTVLKKLQNEINKTSSRNKNITDTIPVYINL